MSKRNINKKIKIKIKLLISLCLCLFLSIGYSNAYFTTSTSIKNKIKTTSYNLKLESNGGSFTSKNVFVDKSKVSLPIPTKYGYNFAGYSTTLNGTIISSKEVCEVSKINNKTIYVKWEPVKYNINYNLNGGTLPNAKKTYTIEEAFIIGEPNKMGYNFLGWTGTKITTPVKTISITKGSSGTRTYTATWEKIDAAITGITISSYRSTDYGENYETWYGNADGYYKVGTSNENAGNWTVTVTSNTVTVKGTTTVTSKNRYYLFYIYAGKNKDTLLGIVEDHPVEYRGSGTKAQIKLTW